MRITAIIPAYNEENRIKPVIGETEKHVDRMIVVDDGSPDNTGEVAKNAGAEVITHRKNKGYLEALKTGFKEVQEGVIITIDADGEFDPESIPRLIHPILDEKADLVIGKRKYVPRLSERFLSFIAGLAVNVSDTGSGFRAMRTDLAKKLELEGKCPCGTLALEAERLGARIKEIPVKTRKVSKSKKIAWKHLPQLRYVVKALIRS